MFPVKIVIGWKATPDGIVPENLYTGLDGVAAGAAAEKARKSEKFIRIGQVTNPTMRPLGSALESSERKPLPPPRQQPPAPPAAEEDTNRIG